MKEVRQMPKYVIIHGRLREVSDDELMHWKYIKREKKNGKWRYYYDVKDALGYDERDRMNKAHSEYTLADQNAWGFQKYVSEEQAKATRYNPKTDRLEYKSEGYRDYIYDLHKEKEAKFKAATEAGKKASDAAVAYYKTPLGKIDKLKSSFKQAKKSVAKMLNRLADKIGS